MKPITTALIATFMCFSCQKEDYYTTPTTDVSKATKKSKRELSLDDVGKKDQEGLTRLHHAAIDGNVKEIEKLLAAGADIEAKGAFGYTPLLWAVEKNHPQALDALLKAGADVKAKGFYQSALHIAALDGYIKIIDVLLKAGADIEVKDFLGQTPVYKAIDSDDTKILDLLLKKKADLKVKDIFGRTPLHVATLFNKVDAVKLLIPKYTDIEDRDEKGQTALDIAREKEKRTQDKSEKENYVTIINILETAFKNPQS